MWDEILNKLAITDITAVIDLKQLGKDWVGECPAGHGHSNKTTTAFNVSPQNKTFYCFNCGLGGNWLHLFELIWHGTCSIGYVSENLRQTVDKLADQFGITRSNYVKTESIYDLLMCIVSIYHYQLLKHPELIKFLTDTYGWDELFIKNERIGYGDSCPTKHPYLLKFFSELELLETGLFFKTKAGKLWHIYQDRFVFPFHINNEVVNTIGRKTNKTYGFGDKEPPKYFKQLVRSENYPTISEEIKHSPVYWHKDFEDILITEGIADFYTAKFHGINSVSAVTVQFRNADYEFVTKYCGQFKTIYICNDNEPNQAGLRGALKTCDYLLRQLKKEPRLIIIPGPVTQKIDFTDYMKVNSNSYESIKQTSVGYIEYLILEQAKIIDLSLIIEKLSHVWELLSLCSDELIEIYVESKLDKYFNLKSLKNLKRKIKDNIYALKHKSSISVEDDVFKKSNDLILIESAQDWVNNELYYTFTVREKKLNIKTGKEMQLIQPYVINSKREIMMLRENQFISESKMMKLKLPPEFIIESWSLKNTPYSIQDFTKKAMVKPDELFVEMRDFFKRFIYFSYDGIPEHLASVIMVSYVYMIFHSCGFIHLWAEKRSGKTTTLEIMGELGFNAHFTSSISDAAIYRTIELKRPLFLLDEAENLNPTQLQRENGITGEKLELHKSGYKRHGTATRCDGPDNTPVTFSSYAIRVFASIKPLDATLEDRTIIHFYERASNDEPLEECITSEHEEFFKTMKNKLHCFGLQYANEINSIYKNFRSNFVKLKEHGIVYRLKELWTPYLCVALLIDKYNPGLKAFDTLLKVAKHTNEMKEAFGKDGKNLTILEELFLFIDKKIGYDGSLDETDLKRFILDVKLKYESKEDFNYLNLRYLKVEILGRYRVIHPKEDELNDKNFLGESILKLLINKEKLAKQLVKYKRNLSGETEERVNQLFGGVDELQKKIEEEVD